MTVSQIPQADRLIFTKLLCTGVYTIGSFNAGIALAAGLTAGPVGWLALSFGALALHCAAEYKSQNPNKNLFEYDARQHNRVTNRFYNFFINIGSVAGFSDIPSANHDEGNRSAVQLATFR